MLNFELRLVLLSCLLQLSFAKTASHCDVGITRLVQPYDTVFQISFCYSSSSCPCEYTVSMISHVLSRVCVYKLVTGIIFCSHLLPYHSHYLNTPISLY